MNVLIFLIIKVSDYRSMLWSLWIIYILFAEKFKAKTDTFSFLRHLFSSWFIFGKNCAHTYLIFQLLKRTHFWTLPWAPYCIDTPLVRGYLSEMSGLWNFSVRVQSWSDKIESDPVLIRQCKIMYFYFALWGKRTTGAILPFANYDWLEAKYFQQCLCLMRQNRHSLSAFPKVNKKVSVRHQWQNSSWSYLPLGESNCLDWSSDKDDTLGSA